MPSGCVAAGSAEGQVCPTLPSAEPAMSCQRTRFNLMTALPNKEGSMRRFSLFVLALCLAAPLTATAHDVEINAPFEADVYGNADPPWHTDRPSDSTADGNTVTVKSGGKANNVYGGYADSDGAGMAGNAKDNSVTISG